MGMFDEFGTTCPRCGAGILFQSKAGPCELHVYTSENVPPAVAGDLVGQRGTCSRCGSTVEIVGTVVIHTQLVAVLADPTNADT